ncbi:MAG: glutamate-1-semialdehyde 2,1-aminomutase [Acidobacteria bacterium]|nr:glutamate-1-semialdehyde 2,1-aminomutase [Acidobacteriota bacterium]MBI3489237.1 glutamate-1-semialdehyde 2,1-aminomutase [Acidobacteriota bacterium]
MSNETLFQEALTHFPGGVSSPVRAFRAVGGTPKFFKKASGAWFEDEDGARFLDLCMSWGPLILGHAHADILAAVSEAMQEGLTFGAPSRRELSLARRIKEMVPFIEKMRFVSSGTEAVMSALRAARGFTGRDRILKFEGCYHGHSDGLLVKAGSGLATFGAPTSAGVPKGIAELTSVVTLDDMDTLERTFAEIGGQLAAAIIEPIPANNGLLLQRPEFLKRLRELCTQHGVVLIFDEVISGFRVAPGGAAERLGITPDMATYGKIIGGGMPVGLYGGRKDIMGVVAPDGPVYQAGTLSGNPVAMAAGLATMEKLTPAFYAGLEANAEKWAAAFEAIPGLHCPRYGSLLWPLFQDSVRRSDAVKGEAIGSFNRLHKAMLAQGVYLPPSGYEVAFLSAAHGDAELARFKQAAAAVAKDF